MSRPSVNRLAARLVRNDWRRFTAGAACWVSWMALPAVTGLGLRAFFDGVTGASPAGFDVPTLVAALLAVEVVRLGCFFGAYLLITQWWVRSLTLLRHNLLGAQLASGGPQAGPPVAGGGAAIPVFRDDTNDVLEYTDGWLDLGAVVLFSAIAIVVLLRVDATLTLVVALPIAVVVVVNARMAERLRRARLADREATARVTGLLGGVCSSVLAVKVAGGEDAAVTRLERLNRARKATALRDKLLTRTLEAFNSSTVDVSIGLVLMLVAGAMRRREFTVGDLALFTSYIGTLTMLPRWVGLALARHRHAQVAVRRIATLLPGGDAHRAVAPRRLALDASEPAPARPRHARQPAADVRLERFGVRGGAIRGVDLHLPPGSFTVVCGPVGSGKSTLLRGLLGLAGPVEGTVRWNGAPVEDPAVHMVPPNAAYVPQVPRLYSADLRDNLTLGVETSDQRLAWALATAAFEDDVAAMPDGLATVVGPRGVRLSGGQLQRSATARALLTDAALLVLDDLSSALDAATEHRVWQRLRSDHGGHGPPTVLAVSHRPAALARADQVVLLADGRVRAAGTLEELRALGLDPLGLAA